MMAVYNRIHKLVLDYTYTLPKTEKALLTQKMRQQFHQDLLPVIESLLQESATGAELIIPKLEIQIHASHPDDLPALLLTELAKELEIELAKREPLSGSEKIKAQKDAFFYFLNHGFYPPYFTGSEPILLFESIVEKEGIEASGLLPFLEKNDTALRRFVQQLKSKHHQLVLQAILPHWLKPMVMGWYVVIFSRLSSISIPLYQLFKYAFYHQNEKASNHAAVTFFEKAIKPFLLHASIPPQKEWQIVRALTDSLRLQKSVQQYQQLFLEITANRSRQNKGAFDLEDSSNLEKERNDAGTSLMAANAGLILLHPFLEMFFAELKLMKNGSFISQKKQLKAVQVLHYLACGSTKTPEHLLSLPKLLCGLDLRFPIPLQLHLTNAQKQASVILLQAVMHHWKPLQGTSVNGLQSSFLQRAGLLQKDNRDWVLHLEKKSVDVLLESLPWSFELIQLPWNNYLLHIQWSV